MELTLTLLYVLTMGGVNYSAFHLMRAAQHSHFSFMTLHLQDKLEAVLQASVLSQEDPDLVSRLWNACSSSMYSLQLQERQLGMGDEVGTCM